jgi:hypothetical protein
MMTYLDAQDAVRAEARTRHRASDRSAALPLALFVACLLLGSACASSARAQTVSLREPGPHGSLLVVPVGSSGAAALAPKPKSRRNGLLLGLGIPTIVISATTMTAWAISGRPNDEHNEFYGCGGYGTPSLMIPIGAFGIAATVLGAKGTFLLPRRREGGSGGSGWARGFGVATYFLALTFLGSVVTVSESICNT